MKLHSNISVRNLLALGACICSWSCTMWVGSERLQCESNADCAVGVTGLSELSCQENVCTTASSAADFSCVGGSSKVNGNPEMDRTFQVIDLASKAPIPGMTIKMCNVADADCAAPVQEVVGDSDGSATLHFPAEFNGYLEATATNYMPVIQYESNWSRLGETRATYPLHSTFQLLAALASVKPDLERGQLVTELWDCQRRNAPGVRFTLEPTTAETAHRYMRNDLPSSTASDTDESGMALFLNAPTGIGDVLVRRAIDGERLAPAAAIFLRPGWLTVASISAQ